MTKALDAAILATAIRRGCPYRPDACTACSCREFTLAALRAALPAEPPAAVIGAMLWAIWADNWGEQERRDMLAAYLALRAHLLGEDASL